MTVIEFYDGDVIGNLCSGIAPDHERVVLVGNSGFSVKVIPITDIRRVNDAVCELADIYGDCAAEQRIWISPCLMPTVSKHSVK